MPKATVKRARKVMHAATLKQQNATKEGQMGEDTESTFEFKAPVVPEEVKAGILNAAGFTAPAADGAKGERVAGTWGKPQLSKKEKMQLKHEKFMSQLIMPGEKAKSAPSSLSTLSSALKDVLPDEPAVTGKNKQYVPTAANKKKLDADKQKFELVLNHEAFRANPLATIKEHLQNEMLLQNMQAERENNLKNKKNSKNAKKK